MQNYLKRFPAFKSRDFSIFLGAQFVSNIGTQMQIVALNWQIYILTHSALALGLIGLFRFIPILFFSLIGGSFADAHNRKKILYATESILAILSIILSFLTFSKQINPALIFLITIIFAVFLSFDMPARQALVPSLVPKKDLANAMSLFSIFFQIAMILGPTISGFLIARSGLGTIYAINAITFTFVLFGLKSISSTGEIMGEKVSMSLSSIKEGLVFVRGRTMIWSTMLLDFFSTFFSGATALLPIFAKDILAVGPLGLGLLYAAESIGALIAGLVVAHIHEMRKQGVVLLTAVSFYALGTIVFGFSKFFPLSFLALIVLGAGDGISTIIRNTIRQLETPDYIKGRMSSINVIFFMGGPQLGDFEAGALASLAGAPLSVVVGGLGTLIVASLMALKIPTLRSYDKHEPAESK